MGLKKHSNERLWPVRHRKRQNTVRPPFWSREPHSQDRTQSLARPHSNAWLFFTSALVVLHICENIFSKVAVFASSSDGFLVDHARAITDAVSALGYVCKETLFALHEPYFRPSKSLTSDRRKRKRKKSQTSTPSESEADMLHYQQQVREAISTAIDRLLRLGRERGMFLSAGGQDHEEYEHGISLKDLQQIDFVKLVELSNLVIKNTQTLLLPLVISCGDIIDHQEILNRIVHHGADVPTVITVSGGQYLLPAHSSFLISDASHLEPLIEYAQQLELFDLVVVDPPWYNKSARRASKYSFMSLWQIKALPVPQLAASNALVALWVTNKPKYIRFAKSELFPYWSVELIAEWHWVKVTNKGELVVALDSPHKKPYETLLIGRYDPPSKNSKTEEIQTSSASQSRRLRDNEEQTLDEPSEVKAIKCEEETETGCSSVKRAKLDRESGESTKEVAVSTVYCTDESCRCDRDGAADDKTYSARGVRECGLETVTPSLSLPCDNSEVKNDQQCHTPHVEKSIEKKLPVIPCHKVICSVPCKMHSRKPPLSEVLSEFLKPHSVCLEMFARSLTPHWTSWGNEVLKFQDVELFDRSPS